MYLIFNLDLVVRPDLKENLYSLWNTKVPSKVLIFGWRLLLNRLSSKMELVKPKIIYGEHNLVCPLCFIYMDDINHLFCACKVNKLVYDRMCFWLAIDRGLEDESLLLS